MFENAKGCVYYIHIQNVFKILCFTWWLHQLTFFKTSVEKCVPVIDPFIESVVFLTPPELSAVPVLAGSRTHRFWGMFSRFSGGGVQRWWRGGTVSSGYPPVSQSECQHLPFQYANRTVTNCNLQGLSSV